MNARLLGLASATATITETMRPIHPEARNLAIDQHIVNSLRGSILAAGGRDPLPDPLYITYA
jgi:hypothetical protein